MALCHITGTLFIPDGSEASNRRIQFQKLATDVVTDDYAGAVVPEVITTKTDANGDVDVYLITGYYVGTVLDRRGNRSYTFKATVPEQSTANIADLIAASDPVEPLPAWLQEAFAARDAAEAAEAGAIAAAEDAQDSADAAAALLAEGDLTQGALTIGTRNSVEALTISPDVNTIQTDGYAAAGDGGAALYRRVATEPTHAGKVQSADGAWWELAEGSVCPEMFGAKGDETADASAAIAAALDYCVNLTSMGVRLDLSPRARYAIGSTIAFTPTTSKQLLIEGNDAVFVAMPSLSGYMIGVVATSGVWLYRLEIRNLVAVGRYDDSSLSFIRAEFANNLTINNVLSQGFMRQYDIFDTYNMSLSGCMMRYSKEHAIAVTGTSMQLTIDDCAIYDNLDASAAIRLSGLNHNVIIRDTTMEVGAGGCIHTDAIDNLIIDGCYIEGYAANPVFFGGNCNALQFEGNWLGYNTGLQEWANIKTGSVKGNVFAQQTCATLPSCENVSCGNNAFIQGSNRFFFPRVVPTMAAGATNVDNAGWFVDDSGVVHLQGRVQRTTDGNAFQLPVGARPGRDIEYAVRAEPIASGVGRVKVWADGTVALYPGGTATSFYLDGVSFRAYA